MIQIKDTFQHASCTSVYLDYTKRLRLGNVHNSWIGGTQTTIDAMLKVLRDGKE